MKSEFDKWFTSLLLHDKSSCLNRDILRWAKPILKHGYELQSLKDLEYKGSQDLLDVWLREFRKGNLKNE